MNSELLFTGGTVVTADSIRPADIRISGDKITEVGEQLVPGQADVVDCSGKHLFPGIIDPHTHMGIPIKSIWSADNFATGSRAALQGGVTTIIDFTLLKPGQTLEESVRDRQALAQDALTDVALHVNLTRIDPKILKEIPDRIADGTLSFKVFTTYKEAGMMLDYPQIETAAKIIAQIGGVLMVHAEDNAVIGKATARFAGKKLTEPKWHGESRPVEAEVTAIRQMVKIKARTGCPIYLVHLTSEKGLEAAIEGGLMVETCPQYLLLDQSVYERTDGAMFVASPPLRTPSDCEALWKGIKTGTIQTIGSDHCPFCRKDKPANIPFQEIPNGMGGVDTLFPTLLPQFMDRGIPLPRLVELTSRNPARIFGLAQKKGNIAPESDADLAIVDLNSRTTSWPEQRLSITDWTAYDGMEAIFPEQVWRRGERLINDGKLVKETKGKFVPGKTPDNQSI